ncbi:MAG: prephenate dehydrogenase/arogenate dehydrogenase family protein [Collinsella sp.]|nr:prephenate dehydrogenase/arogenate dehydrogenase family protein [Collinsella sp.]
MSATEGCVGIVGIGLIGGSLAKAYHAAGWRVLGCDTDADTLAIALIDTIDGVLRPSAFAECDLIILAAYPKACVEWLELHADALGSLGAGSPIVMDTAGVKEGICQSCFELASAAGFPFCGAHPMAGTEHSGFAWSSADLFRGAPMVLVPPALPDIERLELLDRLHTLLAPVGFGRFSVTTPQEHDRVIAFTSQLAHVVSNAYVKSPTARTHHGFSAGSYRDLTRVAKLNPEMWSELMVEDASFLAAELDHLIGSLGEYRDALVQRDEGRLRELLDEGDRIKREIDDQPRPRR